MAVTGLRRVEAVNRLRYLLELAADETDITVVVGPSSEPQQGKLITLGDISGELSVTHMNAGRKTSDDLFEIEVVCIAWEPGVDSFDECDLECQRICEMVRTAVADFPRLERDARSDGLDGVTFAVAGRLDGPNRWWNAEGVGAAMRLTVQVSIRIV
jgi:hypothetical protein